MKNLPTEKKEDNEMQKRSLAQDSKENEGEKIVQGEPDEFDEDGERNEEDMFDDDELDLNPSVDREEDKG